MAFSTKELEQLRNQVYQGYITRSVPRYEMRGAGSGRAMRQTGYRDVISFDAYKGGLWGKVADEVGIKNINSTNDLRAMYDYVNNYRPSSSSSSSPAPAAPQQLQISQASKDYRAETEKLLKEAQKARDQFKADQEAAVKAQAIAAANQGRGTQAANLQIQPASSTPTTAGTQPFKRRRDQFKINTPAYSGLSISQSGMVNV
jgi:hypothetical protein